MGTGGLFWFFIWLQVVSLSLVLVYLRQLRRHEHKRRVILKRLDGSGPRP